VCPEGLLLVLHKIWIVGCQKKGYSLCWQPMFFTSYVFAYLLIAPRILLLLVLGILVRRQLYREFPFFFAYIVQEIIQSVAMFVLIFSHSFTFQQYTVAYSIAFVLTTIFSLGVLYELFLHTFSNYTIVERWGKALFRWSAAILLLVGVGLAAYTGSYGPRLIFVTQLLNRTVSILQCGLLIALFVFAAHLGLSWRSRTFGIALGVGILASTDLAASAIRSQTGLTYHLPLDYMVMVASHCSVVIWIIYLYAPERSYVPKALPHHDLETWNHELERLLKQ
jgi:hypothetical protein